jgi:hypothetical protein
MPRDGPRTGSDAMADVLFLLLILGFLAASRGLVELCDRI